MLVRYVFTESDRFVRAFVRTDIAGITLKSPNQAKTSILRFFATCAFRMSYLDVQRCVPVLHMHVSAAKTGTHTLHQAGRFIR